MKKFLGIMALICIVSCSQFVDRPNNLIPPSKMSELIAEMSLNEEATFVNPSSNQEAGVRYILKKHNIQAANFSESYKYYVISQKLEPILNEAQEILKKKHPEAEKYIEKNKKNNPVIPPFAR